MNDLRRSVTSDLYSFSCFILLYFCFALLLLYCFQRPALGANQIDRDGKGTGQAASNVSQVATEFINFVIYGPHVLERRRR